MFRIFDKQNRTYEGIVFSPDNTKMANNSREVTRIAIEYGAINITGRDEMILPKIQFKGCIQLTR